MLHYWKSIEPARHPLLEPPVLLALTMQFSLAAAAVSLATLVGTVVAESHTVHFDNR